MIAMHPWGEQGFITFEEWSKTSTNPEHKKLGVNELRVKWDTIQYDSSNTQGRESVIGWAWLQKTASTYEWNYNDYSTEQVNILKPKIKDAGSMEEINDLLPQIKDAYLTAADLELITNIIQGAIQVNTGNKETLNAIRKLITADITVAPDDDSWSYALTDKGNVQRLHALYNNKLYFIPELKEFIIWDDHKWLYRTAILDEVFNTIEQIPHMEQSVITPDQTKQLTKWQHICEGYSHIKALSAMSKEYTPLRKDISELNTHNTIIGTPSNILNLTTGIAATNTPDHFISMYTGVDLVPDAKCPRWDQFILEIMNGNEETATFMQKLAGYCLYGGNPEQLFIILEGHGANGKTTFVNVLQHVFGNYAATAAADTITRPAFNKSGSSAAPDIVRLYRKRLVICNEWNEGTYINESLIKVLSGGGDEIAVRALYSNKTISYTPEFVIMLATNHRPNIAGMDYGIWRRLLIIPFEVNFTDAQHTDQRDPHLEQYLKENEAEGILNWLVEGYRQWQEEPIDTNTPQKLLDIKMQYKLEMDIIGQFLQEHTENMFDHPVPSIVDHKVKTSELYRAYSAWSLENGYKAKGSKSFSQALIHRGFRIVRIGTVRGFKGIRLLTPGELLAPTIGDHSDQPGEQGQQKLN